MDIKCLLPFLKESTVAVHVIKELLEKFVQSMHPADWQHKALAVSFKGLAMIANMFVLIYLCTSQCKLPPPPSRGAAEILI
jgi:hypothetical protein